jgi:hypothetical protein
VPEWPEHLGEPNVQELIMWNELWRRPQAIVWHNDGAINDVVIYIRAILRAVLPDASPPSVTAARQCSEQLLLSIPALRGARYFIEGGPEETFMQDPDGPPQAFEATGTDGASSVRDMFRVVRPADDNDADDAASGDD